MLCVLSWTHTESLWLRLHSWATQRTWKDTSTSSRTDSPTSWRASNAAKWSFRALPSPRVRLRQMSTKVSPELLSLLTAPSSLAATTWAYTPFHLSISLAQYCLLNRFTKNYNRSLDCGLDICLCILFALTLIYSRSLIFWPCLPFWITIHNSNLSSFLINMKYPRQEVSTYKPFIWMYKYVLKYVLISI